MERIPELLESLDREETVKQEKNHDKASLLLKYKQEALKCEQRLKERKKLKHQQLLDRMSAIQQSLQNKHEYNETVDQIKNQKPQNKESSLQNGSKHWEPEVNHDNDELEHSVRAASKAEKENELTANQGLVESFTKLDDLQNQQKNLESWYHAMSEQLELEQQRLTEKFDEMRVKILQKKQYYLQTSQEYISNLSYEGNSIDKGQKDLDSRPKTAPEMCNRGKKKGIFNEQAAAYNADQSGRPGRLESSYTVSSTYSHRPEAHNGVDLISDLNKLDTASKKKSPSNINYISENNITSQREHSYAASKSVASHGRQTNTSLNESNELIDKTLHISPIQGNKRQPSLSQHASYFSKGSIKNSLLEKLASSDSPKGENFLVGMNHEEHLSPMFSNLSHSTPLRNGGSFVEDKAGDMIANDGTYATEYDASLRASFDRLGAVAVGYLTRKLFRTQKVQTLIKTIKDTKSVLATLQKESSSASKYSVVKAEQQLKANVQHELINAQSKLYSILLNSTAKEKIDIISKSRDAEVSRESQQLYKDRPATSLQSKRLSAVTQKTIRRKLENQLNQKSLTRPHTSPAGKITADGKKQRKAWDIRSQKPIPSDGSPLYSERKKNLVTESQKTAEATVLNIEPVSVQSEGIPLKRKTARKRQLAVTLNRKASVTNG